MKPLAALIAIFLLVFMATEGALAASKLLSAAPDETKERVVLQLDKKTVYKLSRLSNPPRVILDIPETLLPAAAQSQDVNSHEIFKLRYAQYTSNPPVVRVVLEVRNGENWRATSEESSSGFKITLARTPLEEKIASPPPPKIEGPRELQKDPKGFANLKFGSGPVKGIRIGQGQIRLNLRDSFTPEIRLSEDKREFYFWVPSAFSGELPQTIEMGDEVFQYVKLEESETPKGSRAVKVKVGLQQPSVYQTEADSTEEEYRILVLPRTQILKVSVVTEANHPQIQIESQVPLTTYKLFKLAEPHRLIVDIPQAVYGAEKLLNGVEGTPFLQLRGAQFSRDPLVARVVIDLKEKTKYEDYLSPDRKKILISLKGISLQENPRVVVIDPGHGGVDPGAEGPGGTQEKEITLAIALRLKALLEAQNYVILMTRYDDSSLTLPPRVDLANQNGADIMLSIHCNSFPKMDEMKGMETYFFNGESFDLAKTIHSHLVRQIKREDRGLRKNSFVVIKYTAMPSLLVETEYLSNPEGEKFLTQPENQKLYAKTLAEGVEEYFKSLDLATKPHEQ